MVKTMDASRLGSSLSEVDPSPSEAHLEELSFTGSVWVTLTLHAKRFFADGAAFRRQRGENDFYSSLINLAQLNEKVRAEGEPKLHFAVPKRADELLALGYRAGVFNQFPISTEFAPVFEHRTSDTSGDDPLKTRIELEPLNFLDPPSLENIILAVQAAHLGRHSNGAPEPSCRDLAQSTLSYAFETTQRKLEDCWKQWSKWLVLTRYGYFQAWLRHDFTERTAAEILTDTMMLQTDCSIDTAIKEALRPLSQDLAYLVKDAANGSPDAWKALLNNTKSQRDPKTRAFLEHAPYLQAVKATLDRMRPTWETYLQWEMARILVRDFASDVQTLSKDEPHSNALDIPKLVKPTWVGRAWYHDSDDPGIVDLPLRWRHTGIHVVNISKRMGDGRTSAALVASEFTTDLQKQVACLFEGVPVRASAAQGEEVRATAPTAVIPPLRPELLDEVIQSNAASWTGELLLLTGDSALLCSLNRDYVLVFDAEVPYLEYWKTILRGIAHLCEMHLLARQLRFDTAKVLAKHRELELPQEPLIEESRRAASLLARLRTASNASVIARGDYARDKFDRAARAFLIEENIESAQRNLELVNAAIQQEEADAIQRTELVLNILVAIYALAAIFLAIPPFWDSATNLRTVFSDPQKSHFIEAPRFYLENQFILDRLIGLLVLILVAVTLMASITGLRALIRHQLKSIRENGRKKSIRRKKSHRATP
jgi:hypothetical protein